MKHLRKIPGFTVLEFLIVLAIIIILVAIALPSLERARVRSYNEKLVTDLKMVAIGLEQFKQSCGEYPDTITNETRCNEDNADSVTLREFIPVIHEYSFNGQGNPDKPNIAYYPFGNEQFCYGFHLGITLRNAEDDFYVGDANIDTSSNRKEFPECISRLSEGFNGETPGVYDIIKQ